MQGVFKCVQPRMTRSRCIQLLLAAAAAALLCCPTFAQNPWPNQPSNPLPCTCTDVDVRTSFIAAVEYDCWQQYKFGQCGMPFMLDAIEEVLNGYCQITCGRCPCCGSLAAAAQGAGLDEFLWAMNYTGSWGVEIGAPGFAATLMAPDNGAMQALFDKLGGKAQIASNSEAQGTLATIMTYHVVRPVPGYEAWTSPFLNSGTTLTTWSNNTITVGGGGDGGNIKLQGGGSSASITEKDIYACKGYINKLDWYLLPPGLNL